MLGVWMWPESIERRGADAVFGACRRAGVTDVFFLTKGLSGVPVFPSCVSAGRDLLREALENAKALLSEEGSLFLHLDSRMAAHARLLCDDIFGESNFVNEIIWAYQSGGRTMKRFSRKHDVILFYRKTRRYFF